MRLRTLELRRQMLVARSAVLRGELAAIMAPAAQSLRRADRVVAGLRRVLAWTVRLLPVYSLVRRLSR